MPEITKPNDMLVAKINNPMSSTYDFLSAKLTPQNTSLLSPDEYKQTQFVKDAFRTEDGQFDDIAFNEAYKSAAYNYQEMADDQYLANLDEMDYSPFDVTRPKFAKTYNVSVEYDKDFNPYKRLYSRSGINSIDDNPLSVREIAQLGKVYDPKTGEWSSVSANDRSLVDKFLGDTLVYAKWDEDGNHKDEFSGKTISHKKGDYKIDPSGNLYLEKLGDREIYGREVVNPMDMLTADGSVFNKFDIFDADGRDKSIAKTTFKIAAEIAPFLIPGVAPIYGGIRAAIALSSVLPTFYKSFEGMLLGDEETGITKAATAAENYMAKFTTQSVSDAGQESLFKYEQLSSLVTSIFSQIYEQRAMAGLSKIVMRGQAAKLNAKQAELANKINKQLIEDAFVKKTISIDDLPMLQKAAMAKLPELAEFQKIQSGLSKSFSLGYMALTSTADIYGEALQSGYDRRTAGFAAIAAAAGQYGIMMNNRMGDWFLDKTTGYTTNINKSLVKRSINGYLDDVQDALKGFSSNPTESKVKLASVFSKMKNSLHDTFTSPSELGEALFKNAFIEGVEEVTEQAVLDATKGMIDTMNYLGLTKGDGSFGGFQNVLSKKGLENYLANFVGGLLGGAMFEFNRLKIDPWVNDEILTPETQQSIYQLVANGQTDLLINEINKNRHKLGNTEMSPVVDENGTPRPAEPGQSQADLIADTAISMIKNIDGIMNSNGLAISDNEIIKKAMLDTLTIRGFEKANSGNKIGIEGLIVDDMVNLRTKLIDTQNKIKKLSTNEDESTKNAETISKLQEEEALYRSRISEIMEGKNAEFYFTRTIGMLNSDIFSAFMILDRKSFTESVYGLNYYTLPEDGPGITKERIEKEWEDYLNSTDIRAKSEAATRAYMKYEKEVNPHAAEYTESGYDKHRRQSLTKVIDLATQVRLFGTTDENRKQLLNNYIKVAKEAEAATGKRILPWDPIITNLADKLIKDKLLSSTDYINPETHLLEKQKITSEYWNEKVKLGESTITRGEHIKRVLHTIISSLPPEALVYDNLVNEFNSAVNYYNIGIRAEMDKLNETITDENKDEVEKQLIALEKTLLKVQLDSFETSDEYIAKAKAFAPELVVLQNEIGINQNDVDRLSTIKEKDSFKPLNTFDSTLESYAATHGAKVSELSDEEIKLALSDHISAYLTLNPDDTTISDLLDSTNEDKLSLVKEKVDRFSTWYNNIVPKYKEYVNKVNALYSSIEKPEIFSTTNYMIEAVIKEIVDSKNLDRELLIKVQDTYRDMIRSLKNEFFKEFTISDNDFLDLVENSQKISEDLPTIVSELEYGPVELDSVPEYLGNIITSMQDDTELLATLEVRISEIAKKVGTLGKTLESLKKLREIINNSDKFISNSIYDFLEKLELHLYKFTPTQKSTVFSILKAEELSLLSASEITNYLSEGTRDKHIQQALNVLRMAESVIVGMSRTEVGLEDPTGFIFSRQQFVKKHNLESDTINLKTIDSATATMMLADINRIKLKLTFLRDLSKNNSGQLFNEQEAIRELLNKEFIKEIKNLTSKNIKIKEKPIIPDLSEIINSSMSNEKKLLEIEEAIFNHFKNWSREDKIEAAKTFIENIKYTNSVDVLYRNDGSDLITKDLKQVSKNDLLMNLFSAMTVSSKDLTNRFLQVFNSGFNKSPFYTQELAVKIAYSSIKDPDLFALASENNLDEKSLLTQEITYILGNSGVGKTSVVLKLLVNTLKSENPNLSIWFAAPHKRQSIKLKEDVLKDEDISKFNSTENFDKKELFERLNIQHIIDDLNNPNSENTEINPENEDQLKIKFENIKFDNISDLPNLILIDEGTHFTAIELAVLNELVSRSRKAENGIFTKIIVAGDPTQNGAEVEKSIFTKIIDDENPTKKGILYNIDRVSGTFAPLLTLTVRSANSQKRTDADMLSTLVRNAIHNYTDNNDPSKVLELLGSGISLKYHLTNNKFNGDMLASSNIIPKDVLKTLKNAITENSNIKIGILSTTLAMDSEMKEAFDSVGITDANYEIFTPGNVQGSELDYFIMPTSLLKGRNIVRSLRKLYTFTTRSKKGTIILNDGPIINDDGTKLEFWSEHQEFSDEIDPIDEGILKENKKSREDIIKKLLDDKFGINNPMFTFNNNAVALNDESPEDNIFKGDVEEKSTAEKIKETEDPKDDYKYMVHSFYNDLNVKLSLSGDSVTLTKNPDSSFSYGLDYLFEINTLNSDGTLTLPISDFDKIVEDYVNLKYAIWGEKAETGKFKVPASDDFLNTILHGTYKAKTFDKKGRSELVIKKSIYNNSFNSPYDKFGDVNSKHLQNGSPFLNLYLKLKINEESEQYYYVHLGTLPNPSTATEFFKSRVGNNNLSGPAYSNFITELDSEVVSSSDKFEIKTGTRTVKRDPEDKEDKSKVVKNTLKILQGMKGLKFYSDRGFVKTPTYFLFPSLDIEGENTNFDNFKKLWLRHSFNRNLNDDKLRKMHKKMAGKPYAVVSFVKSSKDGEIVLLKSKTRSFKEIRDILKNPYNSKIPKSMKQHILSATEKPDQDKLRRFTGNLFSGNQVLDMIVDLVINNKSLFNSFFITGEEILKESTSGIKNKEFLTKYLSGIGKEFEQDLLQHITYAGKSDDRLRQMFVLAKDIVEKNREINKEDLKTQLLKIARGSKNWYNKFWNFFSFRNTIEEIVNDTNIDIVDVLREKYKKFGEIMDMMINRWEISMPDGIYHNVVIRSETPSYVLDRSEQDLDMLYTSLTPEGLYALVDLSAEINSTPIEKSESVKESDQIKDAKQKLARIKVNGEVLLKPDTIETIDSITNKIERAKVIKKILESPFNTSSDNVYTLDSLQDSPIDVLNNVLNSLSFKAETPVKFEDLVLETVDKLKQLSNLNSEDRNYANNFAAQIEQLSKRTHDSSSITESDYNLLQTIVTTINNKLYPKVNYNSNNNKWSLDAIEKVSLIEFLSSLPSSDSRIDELLNLGTSMDLSALGIELSNFIRDHLEGRGFTLEGSNLELTSDLFAQCNI